MRYYNDEEQVREPPNDDRELPDPEDMSSGDEPGVESCLYCRRLISEEAEQCPYCRSYLSDEDRPGGKKSIWVTVIILALLLLAVVGWLVGR
jgi:hypothetical protein